MLKNRLQERTTVKLSGVRFVIRKLNPSLFMDKDYMFPISNVMEAATGKKSTKNIDSVIDDYKDRVKDIIMRGVVGVKGFMKLTPVSDVIEDIMDTETLYNALFAFIVGHTMGLKKKGILSQYKSVERLQILHT